MKVTLVTLDARSVPSTSHRVLAMSLFGSETVAVNILGDPHVTWLGTLIVAVGGEPVAAPDASVTLAVSVVVPLPQGTTSVVSSSVAESVAPF